MQVILCILQQSLQYARDYYEFCVSFTADIVISFAV